MEELKKIPLSTFLEGVAQYLHRKDSSIMYWGLAMVSAQWSREWDRKRLKGSWTGW